MDNSQYLYNEKIILLICSAVFIIIYIIYLFPILIYIFKKCLKNKLCVYWIDYSFLIASGIIFIFTFIIKINKGNIGRQSTRYKIRRFIKKFILYFNKSFFEFEVFNNYGQFIV